MLCASRLRGPWRRWKSWSVGSTVRVDWLTGRRRTCTAWRGGRGSDSGFDRDASTGKRLYPPVRFVRPADIQSEPYLQRMPEGRVKPYYQDDAVTIYHAD